jgi:hypothetical protein
MSFSISSSKLTGNPGETGWAQVHDFKPDDVQKYSTRGHFFAVIATKGKPNVEGGGIESVVAGRELITRLHEEYYGSTQTSSYNAIKDSCGKVINEFRQVWGNVEIAACAVIGDVVYTASGGGAAVSILREGMLAKILESGKSSDKDVVSASGYPKDSDVLVLATSSFLNIFPDGIIRGALIGGELSEAVEKLAPTIHSGKEAGDVGAVFIKFKKEVINVPQVQEVEETNKKRAKVKNTISLLLDRVRRKTENLMKLPERKIFIRQPVDDVELNRGRKLYISVGIILLLLLVISIGFGIKRNIEKETKSRYQDRLVSARHQFDEAVGLYQLDANRARELYSESQQVVNALIEEGVSDPELSDLSNALANERGKILGEYQSEAELFVELSLISDGFKGIKLFSTDDSLYVLNEGADRIIKVSFDTKRSEVVAGPDEVRGTKEIAVYSDRVYTVKDDGVYEIGEDNKRIIEASFGEDFLIYSYAGNIYILRKNLGVIERYTAGESGFSSGVNWISSGVEPDLENIISWSIDGSIWMLDASGEISRYTFGNPQEFNLSSISPALKDPKTLFTSESLEYIYILDPSDSRVVVIDKEGNFKAQYKGEEIKEAKALAVTEVEKKIILLTGEKLLSIEIKHF